MSIRVRIALLSAMVMTVILLAVGSGVYLTLQRSLRREVDDRLERVVASFASQSRVVQLQNGEVDVRFPTIDPFASRGVYIQVTNREGQGIKKAPDFGDDWYLSLSSEVMETNVRGDLVYYTTQLRGIPVRILSAPLFDPRTNGFLGTVQVAESLTPMRETLTTLRWLLLAGLGFGTVLAGVSSYLLSGRSLRPLRRITTTARAIGGSGDLSQRIEPPRTGDEVQDLAETFNAMLERLDDAFAAERRFVSDASHELRTPLTALRGNAEILLRQIDSGRVEPADLTEALTDIRDEAERMGRLVQNLLTLARADVGWRPDLETVQLDQVASDAARVAAPLAGKHRFSLQVEDEVDVIGNADQLKQLIMILLDNAFTYSPPDGEVSLTVRRAESSGMPELVVHDSGPGIPPDQLDRIFDRFYRGEAARNQRTTGAGLGLAIARWIAECHHGSIRARSTTGEGTTITVQLMPPSSRRQPVARQSGEASREPATVVS